MHTIIQVRDKDCWNQNACRLGRAQNIRIKKKQNARLPVKKCLGVKCPSIYRHPLPARRKGKHKYNMALPAGKVVFIIVERKILPNRKISPMPMISSLDNSSFPQEKRDTASISCI